jgi:hexosaminidase
MKKGFQRKFSCSSCKNGYKTVLSNGYYLDLMQNIKDHYLNPKKTVLSLEEKERILGGEATMWNELVTPLTIDSRIWNSSNS